MRRFSQILGEFISGVKGLSSFRNAFVAISLVGVPTFISLGLAVQASNAIGGLAGTIIWFTVAAVDTTLFFWLWQEVAERTPTHRKAAIMILGAITIFFYYRGVNWAVKTAYDAATTKEITDQADGLRDAMEIRMYYGLKRQQASAKSGVRSIRKERPSRHSIPPKPSFVFVAPGVVLNGTSWDFIVNHRGPHPSIHVEMLFVDDIKKEQILKSKKSLTPRDLNAYQRIVRYTEIDPRGRQGIFATQFIWKPPVLNHERYTIDFTWREGKAHQELQVERVNGKWFWATQVTDGETGKVLMACKDKGFPFGPPLRKRCFPEMAQPGI